MHSSRETSQPEITSAIGLGERILSDRYIKLETIKGRHVMVSRSDPGFLAQVSIFMAL